MAGTSIEKPAGSAVGDVPEPGHAGAGGELEHTSHGHLISYNPDAPSEQWGWHGSFREFAPRGSRVLLWIGTLIMFVMLIGNHVSHVEDYYLVGVGLLMAFWLLRTEVTIRKERRRRP